MLFDKVAFTREQRKRSRLQFLRDDAAYAKAMGELAFALNDVSDEDEEGVSSGNYEPHDNLVLGPIISHDTI